MINILKNNYGIDINYFEKYEDSISFIIDGDLYYLKKTVYDEKYLLKIRDWQIKLKESVQLHEFVFNNNGNLLSEGFVLFKCHVLKDSVSLDDVLLFNSIKVLYNEEFFTNMSYFWEIKIDYLEKQLSEISSSMLVNNSFDYYVGIAENLISFLKQINYDSGINYCLSHRVFNSLSLLDFYCPLNICIDYPVRDLAMYLRLTGDMNLLENIVEKINNNSDKWYFFVRLAFPFSYFNELYDVIIENEDEKKLINIVNNINQYEKYLLVLEMIFGKRLFYWLKKE